jgi:hypothetical protein
MNAKLAALGFFAAATLSLPVHAEGISNWGYQQWAMSAGLPTVEEKQTTSDSHPVKANQNEVTKVAGPAQAISRDEPGPTRKSRLPYEPDFPVSP